MKKLVRASEDMTNLLEDYSELRGYLKAFVEGKLKKFSKICQMKRLMRIS